MAEAVENKEVEVTKKGGSNLLLIIVASLLFLILIGGGIGAYLLLNEDKEIVNDANKAVSTKEVKQKKQKASKTSVRQTDYTKIGKMYPLEQFVVNLYSEAGDRYLKTTINFEISSDELTTELDSKKPLIRDIVIKDLSAKTYEEISTIKGKEKLKDEIVTDVNDVLSDGKINNIFFTDFVIQ